MGALSMLAESIQTMGSADLLRSFERDDLASEARRMVREELLSRLGRLEAAERAVAVLGFKL